MGLPPLVYVGPSLPVEAVQLLLPGAHVRPPLRRGELYRDRMVRYAVFVILDGAFFQHEAVSPREIVDVIGDGALVVGAASMGALRAAECWPAGMHGLGVIYRLFRAGWLDSDDEVAVAFAADASGRALSVPLVNVRYAASRASRAGRVSATEAAAIIAAARQLYYPDRTWTTILQQAGVSPTSERRAWLERHDLKRDDATRALQAVRELLERSPAHGHRPRRSPGAFSPSDWHREQGHDALAGEDRQRVKRAVCRLWLVSGRYREHLPALSTMHRVWPDLLTAELPLASHGVATADGASYKRWQGRLWAHLGSDEDALVEPLWAELGRAGQTDAAVYRWRALERAHKEARARGWTAGTLHRLCAETEIAQGHGFLDWPSLLDAVENIEPFASRVRMYCEELALSKRIKEGLFRDGLG